MVASNTHRGATPERFGRISTLTGESGLFFSADPSTEAQTQQKHRTMWTFKSARFLAATSWLAAALSGCTEPATPAKGNPNLPSTPTAATITGVAPAELIASLAHQTIHISGSNFQSGLTLSLAVNDAPVSAAASDLSNLTSGSVDASLVFPIAGPYTVQVTNPGAAPSNAFGLTAVAAPPVPVISSIAPSRISASPAAQLVTIHGMNFQDGLTLSVTPDTGATLKLTGSQIQFMSPTSFIATVTFAAPGDYAFQVTNPDRGSSSPVTRTIDSPPLPGPPAPQVFSFSPSVIIARPVPQNITVSGTNFAAGLRLFVTSTATGTFSVSGAQITRVSSSSFDAALTIPTSDQYSFQVVNPDGQASNVRSFAIAGAGSPACAAGGTPPRLGNNTGQAVPQAVFAEGSSNVGIYASLFENDSPTTMCGGGLLGPCPYVDAASASGACRSGVSVLCGCISGGFEAHFTRAAPAGACTATFIIHNSCGVLATRSLTFDLPQTPATSTLSLSTLPTAVTRPAMNEVHLPTLVDLLRSLR